MTAAALPTEPGAGELLSQKHVGVLPLLAIAGDGIFPDFLRAIPGVCLPDSKDWNKTHPWTLTSVCLLFS